MARVVGPRGRLVLDTSGLLALADGERRAWGLLQDMNRRGLATVVPAVVIAQAFRGVRPDSSVDRVLRAIGGGFATTARIGRTAGVLQARAGTSDAIDAIIAAEALDFLPSAILTSDADDFERLLAGDPVRPRISILSTLTPRRARH